MELLRRLFGRPSTDHTDAEEASANVSRKARELEREVRRVEAILAAERSALEAERR